MRQLHMIGNAHIDLAWLWPWQEGFAEVKATFLSALQRLDEYDGFVFTSSSAQYYAWIEENDPTMFAQIKRRVAEGRWILCGGWWVQPDCNLPGAESFVRQGLCGQQFFMSRFGKMASVAYNVDSFGHNGGLPQIFRKSGMDSYLFLRPMEHEKVLPNGAFCWEGVDGSSVTGCRIPANYSSLISLEGQLKDALQRFPEKSEHFVCFYGVGNHGGGPTIANIRYLLAHEQLTQDCQLCFSDPRTYFDAIASEGHNLPVVRGDLHHHAPGCYSVNHPIKAANRQAEHALVAAETFSILADQVCPNKPVALTLDDAWHQLLACQFHDILAGACIETVCNASRNTLGGVQDRADRAVNQALQAISFQVDIPYTEKSQPLVVFNPHSFPIRTVVFHEKGSWGNFSYPEPCCVMRSDGTVVPHQFVHLAAQLDERKRIAFLAEVPPMGYETYSITTASQPAPQAALISDNVLENDFVRVSFDPETGLIHSFYDKQRRAELLKQPSGQFIAHPDCTDTWAHGAYRFDTPGNSPVLCSLTKLEHGPVYQQILAIFRLGHSSFNVFYTLRTNSPELHIKIKMNWQETDTCLKYYLHLNLNNPIATWEVPFGALQRPTTGEEEPLQTWVDISDNGLGLSVVNHTIGGAHIQNSTIGLTLLRCPIYAHHAPHVPEGPAEMFAHTDQGLHEYELLLLPHGRNWQDAHTPEQALLLNRPAVKITETFHAGVLPQQMTAIEIDKSNVLLSSWKAAEDGDGTILRLYEAYGVATDARISLLKLGQTVCTSFSPFEVKTFRIKSGSATPCLLTEFPITPEPKG